VADVWALPGSERNKGEPVGWFGCWAGELSGPAAGFRGGRPRKGFKALGIGFGLKAID
jgi:hypothetical protein